MTAASRAGLRAFFLVAFGQFVSLTGSAMTQFALSIWAWERTGEATALALVQFFSVLPVLLLSPVAGPLVDRWNRKLTMMLSDLGAGATTIGLFILYSTGHLEIWHIYVAAFIAGAFTTFQWPAYSAAISLMVRKEDYGRANALFGLAENAAVILAPSLAAALLAGATLGFAALPPLGISSIMLLDIATFLFAIGALLIIRVPQPERSPEANEARSSLWREMSFGFRYILQRPSLLGLQLTFMGGNFFSTIAFTLVAPMILARTGGSESILGVSQSAVGIGGVVGGLVISAWGGLKRRVAGVLLGWLIGGTLIFIIMGLGQRVEVWVIAALLGAPAFALVNSSNQAIWQSKVPPDIQGKVFSARRLIAWLVNPVAALVAGPLADRVMEPAFMQGGALARPLGWLVGTGPGAGIGFVLILCGIGIAFVVAASYSTLAVRQAETILPDHDAIAASSTS